MAIAFVCLAFFAIVKGESLGEPPPPAAAECETAAWSEWIACPAACGESQQTRARLITVSAEVLQPIIRAVNVAIDVPAS